MFLKGNRKKAPICGGEGGGELLDTCRNTGWRILWRKNAGWQNSFVHQQNSLIASKSGTPAAVSDSPNESARGLGIAAVEHQMPSWLESPLSFAPKSAKLQCPADRRRASIRNPTPGDLDLGHLFQASEAFFVRGLESAALTLLVTLAPCVYYAQNMFACTKEESQEGQRPSQKRSQGQGFYQRTGHFSPPRVQAPSPQIHERTSSCEDGQRSKQRSPWV